MFWRNMPKRKKIKTFHFIWNHHKCVNLKWQQNKKWTRMTCGIYSTKINTKQTMTILIKRNSRNAILVADRISIFLITSSSFLSIKDKLRISSSDGFTNSWYYFAKFILGWKLFATRIKAFDLTTNILEKATT